jgi:hypothetical protein
MFLLELRALRYFYLNNNGNVISRLKSAFHTTFIGILAAGAAFGITYGINKVT